MNDVQSVFSTSEMALAAYSTLSADMENAQYQAALEQDGNGMTSLQAAHFASTWKVVDQFNDELTAGQLELGLGTGLFVTIFENRETGEQTLAIRGAGDLQDVWTDVVGMVGKVGVAA